MLENAQEMTNKNTRKYYVFRTDDSNKQWIFENIEKGILRQGWGISGTSLVDDNGKEIDKETWKANYKAAFNVTDDREAERRYCILYPLLEMNPGDIVVIPKMPDWQSFTIAQISGKYWFDKVNKTVGYDGDDFRHCVNIDTNFLIVPYEASGETRLIKQKLRAYQAAINNVYNEDFINAVEKILQNKIDITKRRSIIDIFNNEIEDIFINNILDRLNKFPPEDIENLVKEIFVKNEFEVIYTNKFDGNGGDADLILQKSMPLISDFADIDLKVYVQVKKKIGIDQEDYKGVEQLVNITKNANDKFAIKILISTATDFTEKCKNKAEENNVILISGKQFVSTALQYITQFNVYKQIN